MSGYVFPCTPCGFPHAGDCVSLKCGCRGNCKGHVDAGPPVDIETTTPANLPGPYQATYITIKLGSHWRFEHQKKGSKQWNPAGYNGGFEVMAIVSNGAGHAVQVREWNAPQYPVYTCAVEWWDPDGIGASDGGRNRFVVWT